MLAVWISLGTLVFAVIGQFGAAVWFASNIKTTVTQLVNALGKLESTLERVEDCQNKLDKRLAIIEDRQGRLHAQ